MAERMTVQIIETKDGVVAVCTDGTIWFKRGGIVTRGWEQIDGPPAPEPEQWGTSKVMGS
jgi:hypothetical protein